jgi:hypothetical protein
MRLDNNLRQAYFMIDSIKALTPSAKVSEQAIKTIKESFNKHGLGKLDVDHLNQYYRGTKLINETDDEDDNCKYRTKKKNV